MENTNVGTIKRPDINCDNNVKKTEKLKIAFGCMVNSILRFQTVLRKSPLGDCKIYAEEKAESATKGLNGLIRLIKNQGYDVAVLVHQDMYFRSGWVEKLQLELLKLPKDWVVAGIIGKNKDGFIAGSFHDMRVPAQFRSQLSRPIEAYCLDECCIIVNLKSGFQFDEGLEGFDIYGTLACLQAREIGSAWIIDCFAEHYCTRSFEWLPDNKFQKSWAWLYEKYEGKKIYSTALMDTSKMEVLANKIKTRGA